MFPGRREQVAQREVLVRSVLLRLVTSCAKQAHEQAKEKLQQAAPRLGCVVVQRRGIEVHEVRWAAKVGESPSLP